MISCDLLPQEAEDRIRISKLLLAGLFQKSYYEYITDDKSVKSHVRFNNLVKKQEGVASAPTWRITLATW